MAPIQASARAGSGNNLGISKALGRRRLPVSLTCLLKSEIGQVADILDSGDC